jgi:haloacetate dehalogenase
MHIEGFAGETVGGVHACVGGDGEPVLLLHGFPQTHAAWRSVAADVADHHTVVAADLPGYGDSAPAEAYDKRATAATMVDLMRTLGHERFTVVGHDRGALVAFRAALDHPDAVRRIGTIGVIPSLDMWESLHGVDHVFAFHLSFLAQPGDLPERMIGADPDVFFGHFLDMWGVDPRWRSSYLDAARRPGVIGAICADYRAGAFVDPGHDGADRDAGRRITQPALAIWEDPGDIALPFDPDAVWRSWADDVVTLVLPGGHFLPEAQPKAVAAAVRALLSRPAP